jgi:hypothetical protein
MFQRLWAHALAPEVDVRLFRNIGNVTEGTISLSKTCRSKSKLRGSSQERLRELALSPAVKRYALVRNPYLRLISAKHSKAKQTPFPNLVRSLYSMYLKNGRSFPSNFDKHFAPASTECRFLTGFQYDYILKLEDEFLWLKDFSHAIGVVDAISRGWPQSGDCFFTPPGVQCADFLSKNISQIAGELLESVREQNLKTIGQVKDHYTPELVSMVNEMYSNDFWLFQYPMWGGKGQLYSPFTLH